MQHFAMLLSLNCFQAKVRKTIHVLFLRNINAITKIVWVEVDKCIQIIHPLSHHSQVSAEGIISSIFCLILYNRENRNSTESKKTYMLFIKSLDVIFRTYF